MAQPEQDFERRPDPDALLALAHPEKAGRLCVFLGAAPGVGKTYAMLARASALKNEGADVVIGLAETHGRRETDALLKGLEVLPRRKVEYRGRIIEEFDVDAALARKPKLLVVDELAHSNAPDSRHPKRWQDVEELLDAGVDVWTALNIQHLESLADVVSRITGVAVRETVPDPILQKAADVILIDITPDELLQRLREGKVYVPETAKRAIENFFTSRNLTALRELALRRTAERVDDQMINYLRQGAIEGPWATSERLLVCVGAKLLSEAVVRAAARLATGLNAPWIALYVERSGEEEADPAQVKRVDDTLRLAERLGAEIARLSGSDLAGEVLRFARRENITQIVVGRSQAGFFTRLLRRSLTDEIVRRSRDIPVHVVVNGQENVGAEPRPRPRSNRLEFWLGMAAALFSVAIAVAVGRLLETWVKLPNLSMIFLVSVVFSALQFGLWAGVVASALSFLAFDFFFIDPLYTFTISEPQEFLSLLAFLIVAIAVGTLAGSVRERSHNVRSRAQATKFMFDFSRRLAGANNLDEILWAAATNIQKTLAAQCVVLLIPDEEELRMSVAWPPIDELSAGEMGAARWACQKSEPAGWLTETLPNLRFQFRPLATMRGVVAVCGIEPRTLAEPLSSQDERMLSSLLEQTAVAIDRSLLSGEAVRAAALEENEKVRTLLLASLSHDLRTPLTSIIGAVTSLRQLGDKMTPADRSDLLQSIDEEAERLRRFVANILDMSRIESGALSPRRDYVDVTDVIRGALDRSRKTFPGQKVALSLAPGLPLIRGDAGLLEQVLFNLLDNAQKYAPESGATIHARRERSDVVISVTDEGPGIKPGDLERIFEKFYRGGRPDGRKAGTGLGLSICRGLVEAMGGAIIAQSPAIRRRGTRIVLRFPIPEQPQKRTS